MATTSGNVCCALRSAVVAATIACAACGRSRQNATLAPPPPRAPPVVDMHVDLGFALHYGARRMDDASFETGWQQLARGGVRAVVVPIFVPGAERLSAAERRRAYDDEFETLARALLVPAATHGLRVVLAMEGADGLADDPDTAAHWVRRGVCFVGLVHARSNALAESSLEPHAGGPSGLSAVGRGVVEAVLCAGGVIDVAHAADDAVDAVIALARAHGAPVIDSHTGLRGLRGTPRNIDDAHARAIASTGGVVAIDLHGGHVGSTPGEQASLDDVVRHVRRAIEVVGIDHVAIGSDLAGNADLPRGVRGAEVWPELAARLAATGMTGQDIVRVFHGNAWRVVAWTRAHGCGALARIEGEGP